MNLSSCTVAIVGRTNVGKSTLFNRLVGGRDALVHDQPGLTRDRKYGSARINDHRATLIDTGGLFDRSQLSDLVNNQVRLAIEEADLVLCLLDAGVGLTTADELILSDLRKIDKPVRIVVNKLDGVKRSQLLSLEEMSGMGFGDILAISAAHGHGISDLRDLIESYVKEEEAVEVEGTRLAIVGRPNVGKSTLVNSLVNDDRCVVFDEPGTTRDSVYIPFENQGKRFVLIDTAGIRRKGRVVQAVEKFSVVKALDSLRIANLALLVIDASEGIVEQDLHVLQYAVDANTGLILVVNKLDAVDAEQRRRLTRELDRRLPFADWLPRLFISAKTGKGVGMVFDAVHRVARASTLDVSTRTLNDELALAIQSVPPPRPNGIPIKLRYVNLVRQQPPTLLIHGNRVKKVPEAYRRYLASHFRKAFKIDGTPIKIEFRDNHNPFEDQKNELTTRQFKQRGRLIQHRKERTKRKRSYK